MLFYFANNQIFFIGMASSGSMTRPPCANREDMLDKWTEAKLDKVKDKDMRTPSCWCGDVCKVKESTDRKKSWTDKFQRGLEEERHQKERMERKQREEKRARQAKLAREEERARKLARARKAQEEDEARDRKGKWPHMTQ